MPQFYDAYIGFASIMQEYEIFPYFKAVSHLFVKKVTVFTNFEVIRVITPDT